MAKTTSVKSGIKKKADMKDEAPLEQAPVWMQDAILKKIGEQAKDWDETPRETKAEAAAAKSRALKIESPLPQLASTTSMPKWSTPLALVLMVMFIMQLAWLSWRTVALTRSLEDLNANVKELAAKVATWSDAETPAAR